MPNEVIKTFKNWPQFKNKFMSFIPKECFLPGNEDICWEWQGIKTDRGYGHLSWGKNCIYGAHRLSYFIFKGNLLKNQIVRHTCDNPCCVNPNHLIIGSLYDNAIDMINRNRHRSQKLNSESVKVIKKLLKYHPERGLATKLADFYKVDQSTISHIKAGRKWKHIHI